MNSPHNGQWRGAVMFSLICAWINGWVNNREAGDLRRHGAHCDIIVIFIFYSWCFCIILSVYFLIVSSTLFHVACIQMHMCYAFFWNIKVIHVYVHFYFQLSHCLFWLKHCWAHTPIHFHAMWLLSVLCKCNYLYMFQTRCWLRQSVLVQGILKAGLMYKCTWIVRTRQLRSIHTDSDVDVDTSGGW